MSEKNGNSKDDFAREENGRPILPKDLEYINKRNSEDEVYFETQQAFEDIKKEEVRLKELGEKYDEALEEWTKQQTEKKIDNDDNEEFFESNETIKQNESEVKTNESPSIVKNNIRYFENLSKPQTQKTDKETNKAISLENDARMRKIIEEKARLDALDNELNIKNDVLSEELKSAQEQKETTHEEVSGSNAARSRASSVAVGATTAPSGDVSNVLKSSEIEAKLEAFTKELLRLGAEIEKLKGKEASLLSQRRALFESAPDLGSDSDKAKHERQLEALNSELSQNTSMRDLYEEHKRAVFEEIRNLKKPKNLNKTDNAEDGIEFVVTTPANKLEAEVSVTPESATVDNDSENSSEYGEIEKFREAISPPKGKKVAVFPVHSGYIIGNIEKNTAGQKEFRIFCPSNLMGESGNIGVVEKYGSLVFSTTKTAEIHKVMDLAKIQVELLNERKVKSKLDVKFNGPINQSMIETLLSTNPVARLNSLTFLENDENGQKKTIVYNTAAQINQWLKDNGLEAAIPKAKEKILPENKEAEVKKPDDEAEVSKTPILPSGGPSSPKERRQSEALPSKPKGDGVGRKTR